jgi:predicted negative regulator of RcsB-dependent stress response
MASEEPSDIRTRILVGGILAGLLATIAGLAWPVWAKPSLVWSPEQAAEFQAAGEALHAARQIDQAEAAANFAGADDAGQSDAQLASAQERFDKIEAELAAAQSLREGAGAWLRWLGLAVMLLCGLGYLASRGD